jgi:hypothetical protein
MYELIIKEQFDRSFSKIKDFKTKKQILTKILELKTMAPIGKKLVGNPYWSIHIGIGLFMFFTNIAVRSKLLIY